MSANDPRRGRITFYVFAALVVSVLCLGWYSANGVSARVPQSCARIGYAITFPGHLVNLALSGSRYIHGGFGGWRGAVIEVGASYMLWMVFPVLFAQPWKYPGQWQREARLRNGRCPACGYERRGLAADATCPECGSK